MPYSGVEAWAENDRMWAAEWRRQRAEIDGEIASIAAIERELEAPFERGLQEGGHERR